MPNIEIILNSFLLADTKLTKYCVEDIFNVDPAKQTAQRMRCDPKFLGEKLLRPGLQGLRPAQGLDRITQQPALARPGHKTRLAGRKIICSKFPKRIG